MIYALLVIFIVLLSLALLYILSIEIYNIIDTASIASS